MDTKQIIEETHELIRLAKGVIERCEAVLAEAEQPELRHGDYGYDENNRPCLTIKSASNKYELREVGSCCAHDNCGSTWMYRPDNRIGNIFADLKAISESLAVFKTDIYWYRIDDENYPGAPIYMAGNHHSVAEVEEHILKLRRLVATYKRTQDEQEETEKSDSR